MRPPKPVQEPERADGANAYQSAGSPWAAKQPDRSVLGVHVRTGKHTAPRYGVGSAPFLSLGEARAAAMPLVAIPGRAPSYPRKTDNRPRP
jgi:hypothetical protein